MYLERASVPIEPRGPQAMSSSGNIAILRQLLVDEYDELRKQLARRLGS